MVTHARGNSIWCKLTSTYYGLEEAFFLLAEALVDLICVCVDFSKATEHRSATTVLSLRPGPGGRVLEELLEGLNRCVDYVDGLFVTLPDA